MGSNCSSFSKNEKSCKERFKKNESQLERRSSVASNSSVFVYQKPQESFQTDSATNIAQPSSAISTNTEGIDSSVSSPISPAQFSVQKPKKAFQDIGWNFDLNLLSENLRQLVSGYDPENIFTTRMITILVCFEIQPDGIFYDQLASVIQNISDHFNELQYNVQVHYLYPKFDIGTWKYAFGDVYNNRTTVIIVVLNSTGATNEVPTGNPLPKFLPLPPSPDHLSFAEFYARDVNSLVPQNCTLISTNKCNDNAILHQVWKDLLHVYPLEYLFGWDWAINKICSDEHLVDRCICICNSSAISDNNRDNVPFNKMQQFLNTVTKESVLSVKDSLLSNGSDCVSVKSVLDLLSNNIFRLVDNITSASVSAKNTISTPTHLGINKHLYNEIVAHYRVADTIINNRKETSIEDQMLPTIKKYLLAKSSSPLVIFGPPGCGKTTLMAITARLCCEWVKDAHIILRFVNCTPGSRDLHRVLSSIVQQISLLIGDYRSSIKELPALLQQMSPFSNVIIILDGLDFLTVSPHIACNNSTSFSQKSATAFYEWIPTVLPDNVHIILTATESSDYFLHLKEILPSTHCFAINPLTPENGKEILLLHLQKKHRTLTGKQYEVVENTLQRMPTPLFIQLIAHCAIFWTSFCTSNTHFLRDCVDSQAAALLEAFEQQATELLHPLPSDLLAFTFAYLLLSKHGLTRKELTELLQLQFSLSATVVNMYALLKSTFQPHFFVENQMGNDLLLCCISSTFKSAALKRYLFDETKKKDYINNLRQYWESVKDTSPRKLNELPRLCGFPAERFLFDWNWVFLKISKSSIEEFLDDITASCRERELQLLEEVLQQSMPALLYDSKQFFSQIHARLILPSEENFPNLRRLLEITSFSPPVPCLLSPNGGFLASRLGSTLPNKGKSQFYTSIHQIKTSPSYFVLLNTSGNELTIWNIFTEKIVRRMTGIPQPKDIKFVDQYKAVVLCNRELYIYDLNSMKLVKKLKGVMNQKMAYYDLHDSNHVVALSRNRMYVNMMNLKTGDCVATFKVGEDRFLNSLLVSANGCICVCGDETQKPFPLLVWDLVGRKLLYDLRVPGHDFVTSLSAITRDGHYVVCVCQEVDDPSPNFIIVYDLQNGTLFKKWKPEVSTSSIAISSDGGCVVTGMVDTSIYIWDLFTGNCRFCLWGHTAPVTFVKLDCWGRRCLTADLPKARDLSLRLWDLNQGKCIASFRMDEKPTACDFTEDGEAIVVGLPGNNKIVSLLLLLENASLDKAIKTSDAYGDVQYEVWYEGQSNMNTDIR